MQATTLIISFIGSLLVLALQPARAFAVYVAVLLWYPTFLTVKVGSLDFMAGRIVAMVLLMRCFLTPQLRKKFIPNCLDKWVIFGSAILIFIPLIAWKVPKIKVLEFHSGFLVDTFFAYLIARFCIYNRSVLTTTAKWIGIILMPLALLGIVESVTGWQPFGVFWQYCPWDPAGPNIGMRFGLYRALGPFGHSIMFGSAFVLFLPFIYWLRHEVGYWRPLAFILSAIAVAGTLSSLSSGPWMMVFVIVGCLALDHREALIKPLIVFVIISFITVGIISNRAFYHVIASYSNPVGGTSWHRVALIDLAIEHFNEWSLAGYGGQDPGWGSRLGNTWTDVTNEYIIAGVQYGMLGVICLCGVLISGIYLIAGLYKSVKDPELKSLYWAMGSVIVMLIIAFNGCAFFSQTKTLFYCILGIIGSSPNLILQNHRFYRVVDGSGANLLYRSVNTYENEL